MKYFTHKQKLVCIIVKKNDSFKKKNFLTKSKNSMQIGSLNFQKGDEVKLHYHPDRDRKISKMTEVLIIKKGKLKLTLFDKKKQLLKVFHLANGDIAYLTGIAHKINFNEKTEIIEIKQGPYNQKKDKMFL